MARMTDEDVKSNFSALHTEARDLHEELAEDRELLHQKYYGDGYPQVKGRSDAVSMDIRDAVNMAMPSIIRVLFGSQRMLEFKATRPNEEAAARDATDYVTQLIAADPDGYVNFYTAAWDALAQRRGYLKVYYDDSLDIRSYHYTGLTEQQLTDLLMDDDGLEVGDSESYVDRIKVPEEELARRNQEQQAEYQQRLQQAAQQVAAELQQRTGGQNPQLIQQYAQKLAGPPPEPIQNPVDVTLYNVTLTREVPEDRVRFTAVPGSEVLYTEAKTLRESAFVAHARNVTMSELRRMGYSEDELEDVSGLEEVHDLNTSGPGREADGLSNYGDVDENQESDNKDPSMQLVYYVEAWVRMDVDGDGIAELRHICAAGSGLKILVNEYANHLRLASMTPYITAHSLQGESVAEQLLDIQDMKTRLLRSLLDNYARSVNPDTIALQNYVNMADLENPEIGRIVRVRQLGAVSYQSEPYHGDKVMPLLSLLDNNSQRRTGINETSQGLNADKLQSTSSLAVDAANSAAMARIEMIVRTMCETGLKDFFRIMLAETKQHVNQGAYLEVNGTWREFDPSTWNDRFAVRTKVAIGAGTQEQQLQRMAQINAKQSEAMQLLGPDNQLVNLTNIYESLAEMTRLAGVSDVDSYWTNPATTPAPQPKPPEPNPDLIRAQTDQLKAQTDQAKSQAQAQLDQAKFQADQAQRQQENEFRQVELELERARLALDEVVKTADHSERVRQHNDKHGLDELRAAMDQIQRQIDNIRADEEPPTQENQSDE